MSASANGGEVAGEVVQLDGMLLRRAVARIEHVANGLDALREDMRGLRATLGRSSSHNLDAQALQQQIEQHTIETRGAFAGFAREHAAMRAAIGATPDPALGVKGSGILGALHDLNNRKTIAIVAVGSALTGGTIAAAVVAALKIFGGH